ncbi:GAF domain-containing protein, partial [Elusimicrobiota bacterium]
MPVKEEEKIIKGLLKISQAISSDQYLEDILNLIVTVTAQVMKSRICSLMLIDEKKQELVIRATQSISNNYIKKKNLKIGEGVAGTVVEENRPMTVIDVTKNSKYKYKAIAKKEGLCSLLCVPLNVKGKIIGAIDVYTSFPHKFSKSEVNILTTVANQAAIVIENSELLVKTRVVQEELEVRKLVERAKGALMKRLEITEEQAFRKIQKLSMNTR